MLSWILQRNAKKTIETAETVPERHAAMVKRGVEIMALSRRHPSGVPRSPTKAMVEELGGREAFLEVIGTFYERLFADPRMRVLFTEFRDEKSPQEHGRLLGSFILVFIGGDSKHYRAMVSSGKGHGLSAGHTRAKRCPHRPVVHQGKPFTWQQSRAWLGHMEAACTASRMSSDFAQSLVLLLARRMWVYEPFIEGKEEDWEGVEGALQ